MPEASELISAEEVGEVRKKIPWVGNFQKMKLKTFPAVGIGKAVLTFKIWSWHAHPLQNCLPS